MSQTKAELLNGLSVNTALNDAATIDSSGNVGIGDATPTKPLTVGTTTPVILLDDQNSRTLEVRGPSATHNASLITTSGHALVLGTNNTERIRIDSSGHFLFNCTSLPSSSNAGAAIERNGGTGVFRFSAGSTTSSSNAHEFINANGVVGTINLSGSATAYNTSSDYRLKENAVSISDGISRIKTLKPYRFNFKTDASTTVDGFFAHEVTAVPEAITGTKDEVDSDNNPVYQGIDQSKLVPLLTAALQEEIAKREALETRVQALEAA